MRNRLSRLVRHPAICYFIVTPRDRTSSLSVCIGDGVQLLPSVTPVEAGVQLCF